MRLFSNFVLTCSDTENPQSEVRCRVSGISKMFSTCEFVRNYHCRNNYNVIKDNNSERIEEIRRENFRAKDKEVKEIARAEKRKYFESIACKAENFPKNLLSRRTHIKKLIHHR